MRLPPLNPFKVVCAVCAFRRVALATAAAGLLLALVQSAVCADAKTRAGSDWRCAQTAGDDWPAFLGPLGTGVTCDAGIAARWPENGPPVVWSKEFEEGYAAPSVRGEKLVVFHGVRSSETVECVRADNAAPIWKFEYVEAQTTAYYGDGPRGTPALSENRCYTYGQGGRLLCLDLATGKQIWARQTAREFDTLPPPFGIGSSPLLEGDLVIVLVGGRPNSGVVAFRAATGETAWQSVGKETWDGAKTRQPRQPEYRWKGTEELISYSSPLAATIHGKRQILCLMRQGLVSVDPQNGHVNFRYWFSPRTSSSATAARPVVVGDRIFLTGEYGVGCVMLKVDPSCQAVEPVWANLNLEAHWSTPIYFDGFLYGFSGREEGNSVLTCVEVKTGKMVWVTRGYDINRHDLVLDRKIGKVKNRKTGKIVPFPFFGRGSLTLAGKRCLILGERGTLALAELSPKGYQEVCRASVPGITVPTWPSPVLAGRKLYIRDTKKLVCLDLAPPP